MSDGFLRCTPPKPSRYLSKQSVLITIVIFGMLLSVAIILGKRAPLEVKKAEASSIKPYPSNALSSLASDYTEVKVPTPVATVAFIPKPKLELDNVYLKELQKAREDRLKRAQEARNSGVSFQGISVSSDSSAAKVDQNVQESQTSTSSSLNPRDDENRQDEKRNFLESKKSEQTTLSQRIKGLKSPYQLMSGTVIPGVLMTGINSDLPGEIIGQVSQNVYDTVTGTYLLIPQGTKVLGKYDSRIVYGQERVLIVWTRLIFPNGKSILLEGMPGVDLSGYAGLSDQVNNHYGKLLTGVVISSLLSAGAQMAEGRNFNGVNPGYDELAAQGAARNINQVGQEITRRNLGIQPTIEIRPGYRFNVFVNQDMILEPYEL
jgi:type IV secretory pathway VirB10-like protein